MRLKPQVGGRALPDAEQDFVPHGTPDARAGTEPGQAAERPTGRVADQAADQAAEHGSSWELLATPGRDRPGRDRPPRSGRTEPWPLLPISIAAGGAALGTLLTALYAGGTFAPVDPGLSDPGIITTAAQPVAKLAMNAAGTVTVGLVLMAGFFLAPGRGELPPRAQTCLRAASWFAVLWTVAALATAVLTFAVLIGESGLTTLTSPALPGYLTDVSQGRAFVTTALLAGVLAMAAHLPRTPAGAGGLLALAITAFLPPVFTGHTATMPNHALAVYLLSVHVIAAALWVGGLSVLVAAAIRRPGLLPQIVPRYSTLALCCFVAVALSGVATAWTRLGDLQPLGTAYGLMVVGKTAALVVLGMLGRRHREEAIPALGGQSGRMIFARLATMEILVMAVAMGLATGLARSHAPETTSEFGTRAALLLGFDLPGPADLRAYALDWRPDAMFLTLIALVAVTYAVGVARLRRRGIRWPVARIAAWYAGLAITLVVTCGGLARYSMVLISAHIVQHVLLTAAVPILLLWGAPVTLALQTMRRRPAGTAGLGPRELLVMVLRSRTVWLLGLPPVAVGVFLATLYGLYFTPLFELSLRNHVLHSLFMVVYVLVGMVCLWPLAGVRAASEPLLPLPKMLMLLALAAGHAAAGQVFATSGTVLASGWYADLGRVWGAPPFADQQGTGRLVWVLGGLLLLPLLLRLSRTRPTPS